MQPETSPPLVLWRFTDGKPGHEKQTLGLCRALARLVPIYRADLPVSGGWRDVVHWMLGAYPPGRGLPPPDLLVGAGHATHAPMLAAQRAFGGRSVVLMRPSLPLALFDLCLIPEHDAPPPRENVVTTLGALNPLTAAGEHRTDLGLILVGGPSSHFQWDAAAVTRQIGELTRSRPEVAWSLTTSRRTPVGFLDSLDVAHLDIHPVEATPSGWLEDRLAQSGEVWVTPDSVSMVYEALTAGCRVGLLDLPARAGSRVARGVETLKARGLVSMRPHVPGPAVSLDEAGRCAGIILEKWFP